MQRKHSFLIALILTSLLISKISAQEKTAIAVLDLNAEGVTESQAKIISDRLRTDLFNIGKFTVLEREKMDEILDEQGFQLSGCTSNECAVEVGKLTGVQQIVSGNIGKLGNLYTINLRLIDVETGEIVKTATEDCECRIEQVLTQAIRKVALILSGEKQTAQPSYTPYKTQPEQKETSDKKAPVKKPKIKHHSLYYGDLRATLFGASGDSRIVPETLQGFCFKGKFAFGIGYNIDAVFAGFRQFFPQKIFMPYVKLDVGSMIKPTENAPLYYNMGAGLKFPMANRFALLFEGGYGNIDNENYFSLSAGISW